MRSRRICRWRDWSGTGLEHLVLTFAPDGVAAESTVLLPQEDGAGLARYRLTCDGAWRSRALEVTIQGDERKVLLTGDGAGRWTDNSGKAVPDLQGAIDIDISATPFTNTLPIRRLGLAAGEEREIVTLYVKLPELIIATDRQRYTCLEPLQRYRYEAADGSFAREVTVDKDGLVVTYPGLFDRVL